MEINSQLYNQVWRLSSIQNPQKRFTWGLVRDFENTPCLEIGCGNNPIIPLKKGFFLETSATAVTNLKAAGLNASLGKAEALPFEKNFFNLVVAWHVLEHVKNDKKAISEISRVLKKNGCFLLAVPIWKEKFTKLDKIVGHQRRYQPQELIKTLQKNNFKIKKYYAAKGLLSNFLNNPLCLEVIIKIYRYFQRSKGFSLPKIINNPLARLGFFLEKMSFRGWQERKPKEIEKAENLVLFCQR